MKWPWCIVYLALLWPHDASSACTVEQRAVVNLEIVASAILVTVLVNDVEGIFILDTGAAQTVVTPDAVVRLALTLDEWTATTMRGVGGIERRRNAIPRSLSLGGIALRHHSVARDSTLRVASLPRTMLAGRRIDGLLGRDFLSAFDLDLAFSQRTMAMFEVLDCSGRFLPWTGAYSAIPVLNPSESALVVPVELDGVPLRALLDSGASRTLVAAPGMARLGLGLERLAGDRSEVVSGMGPHTVTVWQHRFQTLRVGDYNFNAPSMMVTPIQLNPICDMLLGADWLLAHRIWISYATHQLFAAR